MAGDARVLRVRGGELVAAGEWVYAWVDVETRELVWVGATALDPATRTWLHLHHDDPEIGRIRAAGRGDRDYDVVAFPVPPGVARAALRDALRARVAGERHEEPPELTAAADDLHARLLRHVSLTSRA